MQNIQALAKAKTDYGSTDNRPLAIILTVLVFFILLVGGISYYLTHLGSSRVQANESFLLSPLEARNFNGKNLRFIRILTNSACPEGVYCIWSGEQELLMAYGYKIFTLKTVTEPEAKISDEYVVRVVNEPQECSACYKFVLKKASN